MLLPAAAAAADVDAGDVDRCARSHSATSTHAAIHTSPLIIDFTSYRLLTASGRLPANLRRHLAAGGRVENALVVIAQTTCAS